MAQGLRRSARGSKPKIDEDYIYFGNYCSNLRSSNNQQQCANSECWDFVSPVNCVQTNWGALSAPAFSIAESAPF